MLALGIILCAFLLSREIKGTGITMDVLLDLIFWVVLCGILGARIFYVFLNLTYFIQRPAEMLMIHKGGLAWQGSLIGGIIAGVVFIRKKRLPFLKVLDLSAPYIALGQSIGRIGCFLNGCCYGRPVGWGIYFPVHDARLHPTQLYSSVGLFLVFVLLRVYRKNARPGGVFILYLILASVLRFFIEFFRADHHNYFLGLSVFQWVCLGIILSALAVRRIFSHAQSGK
jgi:phosphatidylglycerol:prolipoprotein diacylglycerol transferase